MGVDGFVTKKAVMGTPDLSLASTSRSRSTTSSRGTRTAECACLCLAFSKTLDGHKAAVSLCYVHFNFCHVLRTTPTTPALAAGVTDHLRTWPKFLDAGLDGGAGERHGAASHRPEAGGARPRPPGWPTAPRGPR